MEVLLVDDDEVFNYMNQAIVERVSANAVTKVFNSGLEIFNHITSSDYICTDACLVLLDIRMPEMNGFEFLEEVEKLEKKPLSKAVIYMLSSTLDERDLNRSRRNELVKGFISKPLTVERFREILWENNML